MNFLKDKQEEIQNKGLNEKNENKASSRIKGIRKYINF